jgi:hypothetical protein
MADWNEATENADEASGVSAPRTLFQAVRDRVRRLGLARRTEEAYLGWVRRFVLANGYRHPAGLGKA